jgi:CHAD domain-containing protein
MVNGTAHPELERKFEGDTEATLDLTGVSGVEAVVELDTEPLAATYYDTRDLRLAARGVTLRERTGGRDAGWHLKVPVADDEKLEVRLPPQAGADVLPEELRHRVRALTRDAPLTPVMRILTRRHEHELRDAHERTVAVVALDAVTATRPMDAAGESTSWSEVEIELIDGGRKVLRRLSRHAVDAGLRPSAWSSKLEHALADTSQPVEDAPPPFEHGSAGAVVVHHLRDLRDALVIHDVEVRCGRPDSIHQMRVSARRLRSALATYRPLLADARREDVRDGLKWLGQVLGRARDLEVMRSRLEREIGSLPSEVVLGPVRPRIDRQMGRAQADAIDAVTEALDGDRYLRLLELLDGLVDDPPRSKRANRPAKKVLSKRLRKAARRVERAHRSFEDGDGADPDALLHEVRKAAKRARYAAQGLEPVLGPPAHRVAHRMEAVQDVLGEHQDSVSARRLVRQMGVQAHLAGENGFTFGLLYGMEMGCAERSRAEYAPAIGAARAAVDDL